MFFFPFRSMLQHSYGDTYTRTYEGVKGRDTEITYIQILLKKRGTKQNFHLSAICGKKYKCCS